MDYQSRNGHCPKVPMRDGNMSLKTKNHFLLPKELDLYSLYKKQKNQPIIFIFVCTDE